ncbi:MAG: lipase family protein, partial [Candidatus Electrothrix sp. AR3]|nr:lipase family protein [Candidatus Electrothrix sp. AR3]
MTTIQFEHKATSFSKINLAYFAYCANIIYRPKEKIHYELRRLGFDLSRDNFFFEYKNDDIDTQCFAVGDKEKIIVAFRGSEANLEDWVTNKKFLKTSWPKDNPLGRVHRGFYDALESIWLGDKLQKEILKLRTNGQSIWFTGHSLGGALAVLAAATLHLQEKKDGFLGGVYTFGQPRLGNPDFAENYNAALKERTYRVVNNNDLI